MWFKSQTGLLCSSLLDDHLLLGSAHPQRAQVQSSPKLDFESLGADTEYTR